MKKRLLVPPARRHPRLTGSRNGAPPGNRNALKHGMHTCERRGLYADIRDHIRRCRALIEELSKSSCVPPNEGRTVQ